MTSTALFQESSAQDSRAQDGLREPAAPGRDAGGVVHLEPARWAVANRHLIRKALAEFSHERLFVPERTGDGADGRGAYRLLSDDGGTEYRFEATLRGLDHWSIPAESITRHRAGQDGELPLDALDFIAEFQTSLTIRLEQLPVYLEEISSTLSGHAYKQGHGVPSGLLARGVTGGADVAQDFQAIERGMTEGHPCFVANNGRLGFGISDYHAFAPETGAPVRLRWIAVQRSRAVFSAEEGLDYRRHLTDELGFDAMAFFDAELSAAGLDPEDYYYMPVHPWQWEHKITVTFAAEIAQQRIVLLGTGTDSYQAQQSIRTFFNLSAPGKSYVKTAMSVVNMGFMRGLSPQYMKATPAINDWLEELIDQDDELQRHGLALIKEKAALGYHNHYYEAASAKGSPYRKMLSALWRESPVHLLREGQQLATMASLLHVDQSGTSFVSALIERSGLSPEVWLRRYFDAYLVPLAHCLFAYELAFMPHGENVILVLEDGVPVRAIMKDIAEEIVLMGDRVEVPEDVARIKAPIPEDEKAAAIFTDVFDCIFRFLAAQLAEDGVLGEDAFWRTAAEALHEYQARHPELSDQFAAHDLFVEEFELSCLNRLQLRNNQHMLDLDDPSGGLQKAGMLRNPLAAFRDR
ncbi:IucA/IucC family protein [Arthrobacter woluwensis]|uniref:Siderophore synthetase component n=1 Tax=Arthrobacter woluwensis TaxID=156980 RepID=A0A1H4W6U3_9MICC|nr:IucA/IucC family siderophore biosynthesis protein [Arthrobacter woluwensis]SEC88963.1 Siderophore synthetase component [Arthrobacter woluwensis]